MGDVSARLEALMKAHGSRLVSTLARTFRDIELAEEVLQDAVLRAMETWPVRGEPERPVAWLFTVARRRALDHLRRPSEVRDHAFSEPVADEPAGEDRLALLFACCHPAIEPRNQVGLVLRTLCSLSVEAVARAFLESPDATRRRLSRASRKIRDTGIPFEVPGPRQRGARIAAVLTAIYLLFNEGYAPTVGGVSLRPQLCDEAIRLGEQVRELMPGEPEVLGLTALMRLHHARRDARQGPGQAFVSLEKQDRGRWRHDEIAAALTRLDDALAHLRPGPYQLQAAIAALHARASTYAETDWVQITALYGALLGHQPTPVVELNAAVALAMSHGPQPALDWVERIGARGLLQDFHLFHAVRGDLLERLGRRSDAAASFVRARQLAEHASDRRYLAERARAARQIQRRRRGPRPPKRTTLTDREWSRVAHLFPVASGGRGRPRRPDRQMLEAVLWVLVSGAAWRALPPSYGPWQTAYHRFRAWEADGRLAAVALRLGPRVVTPPPLHSDRSVP